MEKEIRIRLKKPIIIFKPITFLESEIKPLLQILRFSSHKNAELRWHIFILSNSLLQVTLGWIWKSKYGFQIKKDNAKKLKKCRNMEMLK